MTPESHNTAGFEAASDGAGPVGGADARDHDTIAAPASAAGGAIAVVRVSGADALAVCDRVFRGVRGGAGEGEVRAKDEECGASEGRAKRTRLSDAKGYTVHYGQIVEGGTLGGGAGAGGDCRGRVIDDVLATVFRAPHSYTGEDSVEISCHGSTYIVSEILRLLTAAGARIASPGEFTVRAYLAGKMDLAQAEAVADLIASSSRAAHTMASTQMRGGYSESLDALREQLLHLASLLELELDFSEEDVQFADRRLLRDTMLQISSRIDCLRQSFALGNAIKEGVAVAIVGAPNVGKSTLLNRLLNEERAMVSDIAGTTRDVVEERANIDGVVFRFLDTAGIRHTDDTLERMGIERTMSSIGRAQIVIHLLDASADVSAASGSHLPFALRSDQRLLTVYNKIDKAPDFELPPGAIGISARSGEGIDALRCALRAAVDTEALYHGDAVVSNSRHYQTLTAAAEALDKALAGIGSTRHAGAAEGIEGQTEPAESGKSGAMCGAASGDTGLSTDLLSEEIRCVIRHLGAITGRGTITPDEILQNIFSKFCIGK